MTSESDVRIYREIDGHNLELEIVRPDARGTPTTGVVFFHGGAWKFGDRSQFLPQCRALAKRGATGIAVTYRLATEGSGSSPVDCADDAAHAIEWVRQNCDALGIDPARIVASGGSAGGQVAAALASMGEELAGLVLFNPALCPEGTPQLRFMGDECPAWRVDPGFPPALVLHGTADDIVPIEHSRRFAKRMAEIGSHCELVEYEGMPHAFFNFPAPKGRYEDSLAEMVRFLSSQGLL